MFVCYTDTAVNQMAAVNHHSQQYAMPSIPTAPVSYAVYPNGAGYGGNYGFVDPNNQYYMSSVSNYAAYQPPSYGK